MKNLITFSIIVFLLATIVSMQASIFIGKPSVCLSCHDLKHQDNPLYLSHFNKNINCIDCHSGQGVRGYVESRKELAGAILLEKSGSVLNYIYQNTSLNHLQANCTKCHARVKSAYFNHSGAANCTRCHMMNIKPENPETGSWRKMGSGGHRNKTCEDCHATDFQIPSCAICHKPHREGMNNSACLACHSSPHVPVRSGSFSEGVAKEDCGACHADVYETLTFYNSKHNQLSSCVSCHPAHGAVKKCFDCHTDGHTSHPFAQNNCAACHGKATCKDCHKEPHAPFMGLPKIATKEQFNDYAKTRKGY